MTAAAAVALVGLDKCRPLSRLLRMFSRSLCDKWQLILMVFPLHKHQRHVCRAMCGQHARWPRWGTQRSARCLTGFALALIPPWGLRTFGEPLSRALLYSWRTNSVRPAGWGPALLRTLSALLALLSPPGLFEQADLAIVARETSEDDRGGRLAGIGALIMRTRARSPSTALSAPGTFACLAWQPGAQQQEAPPPSTRDRHTHRCSNNLLSALPARLFCYRQAQNDGSRPSRRPRLAPAGSPDWTPGGRAAA